MTNAENAKTDGLRVIGWTKYSPDYREWGEVHLEDDGESAELVVMNEIRKRGFKFGGNYHQYGEFGCPVLSDGSIFMVSMRHWGGIMATVWGGGDYCDYAWGNVNEIKGGKAPTQDDAAEAVKWTEAELQEREERRRKANEEMNASMEKLRQERERRKLEDRDELWRYLKDLFEKYQGREAALVNFLSNQFFEISERYHMKPLAAGMKWVLYEEERDRLRKESLENFKKNFPVAELFEGTADEK